MQGAEQEKGRGVLSYSSSSMAWFMRGRIPDGKAPHGGMQYRCFSVVGDI